MAGAIGWSSTGASIGDRSPTTMRACEACRSSARSGSVALTWSSPAMRRERTEADELEADKCAIT